MFLKSYWEQVSGSVGDAHSCGCHCGGHGSSWSSFPSLGDSGGQTWSQPCLGVLGSHFLVTRIHFPFLVAASVRLRPAERGCPPLKNVPLFFVSLFSMVCAVSRAGIILFRLDGVPLTWPPLSMFVVAVCTLQL